MVQEDNGPDQKDAMVTMEILSFSSSDSHSHEVFWQKFTIEDMNIFCHSILQSLGGVQFSMVFSHFAQYVFPWLLYTLNEKEDIFQYSQTQALGAWGEGMYSSSRVMGSKRGPLVSEFVSY